jgi:hypothetical protein
MVDIIADGSNNNRLIIIGSLFLCVDPRLLCGAPPLVDG